MALVRLTRPSALTTEHLGVHVEGTEAGGLIDGGLSDFQHCVPSTPPSPAAAVVVLAEFLDVPVAALLAPEPACPLARPRTDAHTHLWLGGQHQVLSEVGGRVAVATPIDPTTELPLPGETP